MTPKMNATSGFDTFQSYCISTFEGVGYSHLCEPVRIQLEKGAAWIKEQSEPILKHGKWGWDATGRQFGKGGQFALVLLIAGIAYNLFKRRKKEEPKPICCAHRACRNH